MDYWDDTLSPAPPTGGKEGVGDTPYGANNYADVAPRAPHGTVEHVGDPVPSNWHTEVHPSTDRHDGYMEIHRGQPKPGSFKSGSNPNKGFDTGGSPDMSY